MDESMQSTERRSVRTIMRSLPGWIERVGWLLVFVGFPLGTTTGGMAFLLLGAVGRVATRQRFVWGLPRSDPFYVAAGLFLALSVLSALLSNRPGLGLAVSLAYFLMIFLMTRGAATLVHSKLPLPRPLIAWIIILSGIVGAVYGLYTYFGLGRARASGIGVTINGLGTISAFMALLGLGYGLHVWQKERLRAGAALVMALISTATLVVTYSRGAWLSFAVGLMFLFVLIIWQQGRTVRLWAGIVLLLLALIGTGLFITEPRLKTRLISTFSLEANDDRLTIWQDTVDMIKDHPLFGVGGGSFTHVYEEYRTKGRHAIAFAHNIVLQAAAEFGLLGLAAFATVICIALIRGWRLARRGNLFHQGLFAAYLSMLVHDLFDNVTYGMNVGGLFWLVTGLLVHLHHAAKIGVEEGPQKKKDSPA